MQHLPTIRTQTSAAISVNDRLHSNVQHHAASTPDRALYSRLDDGEVAASLSAR
jgi:hypothetical protein